MDERQGAVAVRHTVPARRDALVAASVFAAAALAVSLQPNRLGAGDESQLLYESVRLLRGEIFLRDIFTIVPPGAHAVFTALFRVFGVSIVTAKLAMAAVHGIIALAAYGAARRLGVGIWLAAAAGLADVALAQPAFPYASPHWLSTMLIMLLLWDATRRGWVLHPRAALVPGLLVGALLTVHHTTAVWFLPCLAAMFGADWLLDRRHGTAAARSRLIRQLAWAAAGVLALTIPCTIYLLATAGPAAVYDALIEFPLLHYRQAVHATWGSSRMWNGHLAAYTVPRLLAWLPLTLVPAAVRVLYHALRGDAPAQVRARVPLLVVAAAATGSILHDPDVIHVAFIAPVFFVAAAEGLDWSARRLRMARLESAIALALIIALAAWVARNTVRAAREFPVTAETAFGRVDMQLPEEAEFVERVRAAVDAAPSRQLFVYPAYPALYLMALADNPTPFQTLVPHDSLPEQYAAARDALAAKRVPLVVTYDGMTRSDDSVSVYLAKRYERVGPPAPGHLVIFRRTADE